MSFAADDPPAAPNPTPIGVEIAKAVAIAALSGVATGLGSWLVDELKARFGSKAAPKEGGSAEGQAG